MFVFVMCLVVVEKKGVVDVEKNDEEFCGELWYG